MHPIRPFFAAFTGLLCCLALTGVASALQVHQQIQGQFASASDVTVKCLECHRQQAEEVLHSTHWTWARPRTINGNSVTAGKKDSLAGFAIDVTANGARCLRCHISTSPEKESFDNPAADQVDCLACHDTSGQYRHGAGSNQGQPPDLADMARSVGQPTPRNCTGCHFADCGLTPAATPGEKIEGAADLADVHMRAAGPAFTCQTCHRGGNGHALTRQMRSSTGSEGCASCHTATPHTLELINRHSGTISCQSCHIPSYAKDRPVLISWNWLMTGKTNTVFRAGTGTGLQLHDQNGFWSAGDIEPVYLWDDGTDQVYTRGQKIQPQDLTVLQQPGERNAGSRLAPFRVLYGTQLYDSKYRYLISPLLETGGEVLLPGSDWEAIARKGMEAMVLPFSGNYGFTTTATYRRINHGVAPAAEALDCLDCHGATGRIRWNMLGFAADPMLETPAAGAPPESAQAEQPPQIEQPPQPQLQGQSLPPQQKPQQVLEQPDALPALPPVQEPAVPTAPIR